MADHSSTPVSPEVRAVFDSYPEAIQPRLMVLRRLVYETASSVDDLVAIEETLKWGEPSYVTVKPQIGSTIRIAWKAAREEQYSMFFKCTANLVPAFRERFPDTFRYGGDRSIDFRLHDDVPTAELKQCIALALTYHRNKRLEPAHRWALVEELLL